MSDVHVFHFAGGKRATKAKIAGSFQVEDDGPTYDVRLLKDAQIAYLVAAVSNSDGESMDQVVTLLNFMERAMTPESAKRFKAFALGDDGGEGLELSEVMEVFRHVLTLAAGQGPTGSSSSSAPPRRRTGARSTATAR